MLKSKLSTIDLRHRFRQVIWFIDCNAAAIGWFTVFLIAMTGANFVIFSWLLGDFFTHFATASAESRSSFIPFALIIYGVWLALTVWLRWGTRPQKVDGCVKAKVIRTYRPLPLPKPTHAKESVNV